MPSTPPSEVRNAASIRNWNRISARRAPSALRTPISRVRSVTEIDMIAMTPMPPTISAIDEITISAKNVAWLIWSQSCRMASCVSDVEVVRLVEPQAVADAHHALDVGDRVLAARRPRAATAAIWMGTIVAASRPRPTLIAAQAELPLVGRVRDDHEVVLPGVEPAGAGRLSNTPTTSNRSAPTRTTLPIGSVPLGSNSAWYGGLAEHDDVPAVLHFGAGEEPAGAGPGCGAVGEVLGRAEDDQRLGLQIAVEHALLRRRADPPAPSWMSTS